MENDFEHIGGNLKAARTAAGLTVDDVVFRARLPRSVVEALEAEDFSVFTSPIYAKSFLAQYSGFLNVDAQPWLDGIEPGSFVPDETLQPVVAAVALPATKSPDSETRGGWWSVLGLLALSAALIVAAFKSYDFFEARFGGETGPKPAAAAPENPPPPAAPNHVREKKSSVTKEGVTREEEELAKPPPRAIIVR